jgi:hypothetical protein
VGETRRAGASIASGSLGDGGGVPDTGIETQFRWGCSRKGEAATLVSKESRRVLDKMRQVRILTIAL